MSYAPHGRGGHHGDGRGDGDDHSRRRRERDDDRDRDYDDSKRQRRDNEGGNGGYGRRGNGNGDRGHGRGNGDRGGYDRGRGGGSTGDRRGGGAGRGRRPRLPEAEFRRKMEEEREELKKQEELSYDNIVTRPDNAEDKRGTKGQPLPLLANFFKVQTKAVVWTLYNYRVDFEPAQERTHDKRQLFRVHDHKIGGYIFDGTNLYSPKPDLEQELISALDGSTHVRISIRQVGTVEPGDIQYLQVYGIIIRTCLRLLGLDELGRHFFERDTSKKLTNHRLEIWPGYSVALRGYDAGLLINVDSKAKVLRLESCLEIIEGNSYDQRRCKAEIVSNSVITKYNRKTYKIHDIWWDKSPLSTFTVGRGDQKTEVSFMDYYAEKYPGFKIQNTQQPLLVSKPTKKDRHRGIKTNILLIPELCNITGLSDSQKKDFNLMRDIHAVTSLEPHQRVEQLTNFMKRLTSHAEVHEKLKEWHMKVNPSMCEVEGRILPAETMVMRNARTNEEERFQVEANADWTNNFKGRMRMYSSVDLRKWVIVVAEENANSVSRLLENLTFVAKGLNFRINSSPEIVRCQDTRRQPFAYVKGIDTALASMKDCQMIFVLLSNNNAEAYTGIKRRCNIDFGVPSQCFQMKHLSDQKMGGLKSVCTKVAIQMNAKLGGEPWIPVNPWKQSHTMVVGFDVHHSGKGQEKVSIGAMVATTNNTFSQFFSTVSAHVNMQNLSQNMCSDFSKCLMAFERKNGELPDRVIMYRDGVGEGDLDHVNNTEVKDILKSIETIYKGNKSLKFTFIIVTKRGNARLMRRSQRGVENPPPGTVVDTVITMPERFDFFLISQQSRRGQTVSPTTYNVLRVEDKFAADKLQLMTHKFTHLYYNWSGTVSVPFVCQYASKLSFLTGNTVKTDLNIHENLANHLYFL